MFPTPHVLQVKGYQTGAQDAHGNAAVTYAAPRDWAVHSIEPLLHRAEREVRRSPMLDYLILAPADDQLPGEHDIVVLDGVDYAVNGRPRYWSEAGPWSFPDAPAQVEIKRMEAS